MEHQRVLMVFRIQGRTARRPKGRVLLVRPNFQVSPPCALQVLCAGTVAEKVSSEGGVDSWSVLFDDGDQIVYAENHVKEGIVRHRSQETPGAKQPAEAGAKPEQPEQPEQTEPEPKPAQPPPHATAQQQRQQFQRQLQQLQQMLLQKEGARASDSSGSEGEDTNSEELEATDDEEGGKGDGAEGLGAAGTAGADAATSSAAEALPEDAATTALLEDRQAEPQLPGAGEVAGREGTVKEREADAEGNEEGNKEENEGEEQGDAELRYDGDDLFTLVRPALRSGDDSHCSAVGGVLGLGVRLAPSALSRALAAAAVDMLTSCAPLPPAATCLISSRVWAGGVLRGVRRYSGAAPAGVAGRPRGGRRSASGGAQTPGARAGGAAAAAARALCAVQDQGAREGHAGEPGPGTCAAPCCDRAVAWMWRRRALLRCPPTCPPTVLRRAVRYAYDSERPFREPPRSVVVRGAAGGRALRGR